MRDSLASLKETDILEVLDSLTCCNLSFSISFFSFWGSL